MCKLDNKIRTCLLALYGTYQYHNLIPASLFAGPRFTTSLLVSIAFLSSGAATRGMAGVGLCIIVKQMKQSPTAAAAFVLQRAHCVNRGKELGVKEQIPSREALREGTAPQGTLIQTDSGEMATPLFSTGVQFQSRLPRLVDLKRLPSERATKCGI